MSSGGWVVGRLPGGDDAQIHECECQDYSGGQFCAFYPLLAELMR